MLNCHEFRQRQFIFIRKVLHDNEQDFNVYLIFFLRKICFKHLSSVWKLKLFLTKTSHDKKKII